MSDLPQLRMRHSLLQVPEARALRDGFQLRVATHSDAAVVADVINTCFEMNWTEADANKEFFDNPMVPVTFVIERDGTIVATASYQLIPEPDPAAGWLHYVGVLPQARGYALGEIVSHRVIAEAIVRRRTSVYLTTDDPRLPAIRTYLRLGFEPDMWHESHADRWAAVMKSINAPI